MKALWIFFILVVFCIYVLFGLHITEGIESSMQIVLSWVIYTILWTTFLNVFVLGYFWSVIRTKTGPTGLRGPSGERGKQGLQGQCSITVTQSFCMQALNEYVNNLYKANTNQSILDTDTQKFPCTYLNDKISSIAASRQYTIVVANLSNDNKPVISIVNYLKSIWKQWFDLIYNATSVKGVWFIDEFADEDYDWNTDKNPFTEIKKYDIYYWGVTRDFRPLRAELCRTTLNYESSKFPMPNIPRVPRIRLIQSNDYSLSADGRMSGGKPELWWYDGNPSISWWRANNVKIGKETYYPVGDVAIAADDGGIYDVTKHGQTVSGDIKYNYKGSDRGPDMKTILVSGDVLDPIGNVDIYEMGKNISGRLGTPKCPDGYMAIGDIGIKYPIKNNVKCVPIECVEAIDDSKAKRIWNQDKKEYDASTLRYPSTYQWGVNVLNDWYPTQNTRENDDANETNGYNLFRIKENKRKFYKFKDSCTTIQKIQNNETKDVEPENAELGIGWNGHPYKADPKYSIFTFLDLVPEGMVVNKGTGRRYYIIHYGGEEANIYIILDFNTETRKYTNALQVNKNSSILTIESRTISRIDERQQWNIVLSPDKQTLKFKNISNHQYLYVGVEPIQGVAQFSCIDLDASNFNYKSHIIYSQLTDDEVNAAVLFSFISSFGTQMNIIDSAKTIIETAEKKSLSFITGNRLTITAVIGEYINLFGVFIYSPDGIVINTDITKTYSSSTYNGFISSNALKIVNENNDRTAFQAIQLTPLKTQPNPGWNKYDNNKYLAHTNTNTTITKVIINEIWEYDFSIPINMSVVEIFGRADCCLERTTNLMIEVFNDTISDTLPVWKTYFGASDSNAHKTFQLST